MIAVEQCLHVMRTNLPRTFASETEYCAEQELQTIITPTSSLSPSYGAVAASIHPNHGYHTLSSLS